MLITSAFMRDPQRFADLAQQHGIQIIVPDRDDPTTELIGDADAVYGQLTADEFPSARNLKWVQSPSAGVEWMWRVPGLQDSEVVVTNMRGAHAATIAEHAFAMLLSHTRGLRAFGGLGNRPRAPTIGKRFRAMRQRKAASMSAEQLKRKLRNFPVAKLSDRLAA